jgi:hypothetical protein
MRSLGEDDAASIADENPENARGCEMSLGGWIMAMMIGLQMIWLKLTP